MRRHILVFNIYTRYFPDNVVTQQNSATYLNQDICSNMSKKSMRSLQNKEREAQQGLVLSPRCAASEAQSLQRG
ncbi:hypothetical protein [Candidatus Berkiella aquae]|uniref:Uncharacterized protein n=1 Tax=Candidatus Berkiella aquae TaxID=295108 RepID=A0A0Q9YMJ0_9GAMM|nr:hypothetical protein [Candidatus Berkiella aquae]MCS5710337.1 hypothetical protein [Candidatus Berkiella aquae]